MRVAQLTGLVYSKIRVQNVERLRRTLKTRKFRSLASPENRFTYIM